jgi:glycosyltransferase involved in cell wall biosynthesis
MSKILHVIAKLNTGGAEKLLLDSIPLYNQRGLSVDLLVLLDNDKDSLFTKQLKEINVCNVYFIKQKSIYNPAYIFKIIPFLKKYNIIHVHLFPALYWVAIANRLLKKPNKLIYTEHNTYNKRRNKIWLKPIEHIIYRQYSKIICISEKTKEHLSSWIGMNWVNKKSQVIHNGINISRFDTSVATEKLKLGIPDNAKIILMIGRFNLQKDTNTLIKAFNLLDNKKDLYLIFIGDGDLRKKSEELVENLGIEKSVLFLGIRKDVPELIKASYVCVLSSNWEGFGLVAVEYMASCRPVIASDVDGLREIVKGAGLLFEKGNVNELKEKLELLLNNEMIYKKVTIACYQKSKEFSIEKMINSYLDVYTAIVGK